MLTVSLIQRLSNRRWCNDASIPYNVLGTWLFPSPYHPTSPTFFFRSLGRRVRPTLDIYCFYGDKGVVKVGGLKRGMTLWYSRAAIIDRLCVADERKSLVFTYGGHRFEEKPFGENSNRFIRSACVCFDWFCSSSLGAVDWGGKRIKLHTVWLALCRSSVIFSSSLVCVLTTESRNDLISCSCAT